MVGVVVPVQIFDVFGVGRPGDTALFRNIETEYAFGRGAPEAAFTIGDHLLNAVILHGLGVAGVGIEGFKAVTVEAIEAVLGRDPDQPVSVLDDGADKIVGQAVPFGRMWKTQIRQGLRPRRIGYQPEDDIEPMLSQARGVAINLRHSTVIFLILLVVGSST
jgi:hypothetical protein